MLLALDVRSRAISIGFFDRGSGALPALGVPAASTLAKGRWLLRRRLGVLAGRSADEYAIILRGLAAEAVLAAEGDRAGALPGGRPLTVKAAWMSSVAPSLGRELARAVSGAFGLTCSVVGPGVRTGVKIRTDVPSEVGSDLICAAVAAKELAGCPCVVVDFDAAIAISAIGRVGDFLGVAIAPGIGVAADALREAAALLPEVALAGASQGRADSPCPAIGKNTPQAIRAGIGIGFAGLVERLVRLQREELASSGEADSPEAVHVLGSGDDKGRELFASLGLGRFVPDLVLEGLAIIAARAAEARAPEQRPMA